MSARIYSLSFQLPVINPTPKQPVASQPSEKPLTVGPSASTYRVIRFSGGALKEAGKRGVWVTTERTPAKVGGFGEVSKTIPEAIARYSNIDLRVIQPYTKPISDFDAANRGKFAEYETTDGRKAKFALASELTNAEITLDGPSDSTMGEVTFRVRQRFEPALDEQGRATPDESNPYGFKGNVVYSLQDDSAIYERLQDIYYDYGKVDPNKYNPSVVGQVGFDPQFKLVMLFNRAAAKMMPLLNASHQLPNPQPGEAWLNQFVGDEDFVIAHDWLTGPMLNELPEDYKSGKVFMLHNTFDTPRHVNVIKQNFLKMPEKIGKDGYVSPLTVGIDAADVVIANNNYLKTITETDFSKGAPYVDALKAKMLQNRVVDMHHGLLEDCTPFNNPALQKTKDDAIDYGYQPLQKAEGDLTPADAMKVFKQANKQALQKEVGLKEDPNAVVFTWVSRMDPNQKGFFFVMNEAEKFLKKNPNAQFVIAGSNAEVYPHVKRWMDTMHADPELKGRVKIFNGMLRRDMVVRINAGSDFMMMPSLYEPYGLTQLESMMLGTVPVVHGVDGLSSTVLDPEVNGTPTERQKWTVPDASYGRTGVVMKPLDVPSYQKTIGEQSWIYKRLNDAETKVGLKQRIKDKFKMPIAKHRLKKDETVAASTHDWKLAEKMLDKPKQSILTQSQDNFREAMDRAMTLASDPQALTEVRVNGLRFVETEHRWKNFVPRYAKAFAMADEATGTRIKTTA